MLQNRGTVISRKRLEDHIWNYDYAGGSNVVDVYITYLRKKIDAGFDKKLIHTVRGAGWVMKDVYKRQIWNGACLHSANMNNN